MRTGKGIAGLSRLFATTDVAEVARRIAALRAAGIRTAIDDFGTGYSNLMQLTGLKFGILKVGRSFNCPVQNEGAAREVSRAIIQRGPNLAAGLSPEGPKRRDRQPSRQGSVARRFRGALFAPAQPG